MVHGSFLAGLGMRFVLGEWQASSFSCHMLRRRIISQATYVSKKEHLKRLFDHDLIVLSMATIFMTKTTYKVRSHKYTH